MERFLGLLGLQVSSSLHELRRLLRPAAGLRVDKFTRLSVLVTVADGGCILVLSTYLNNLVFVAEWLKLVRL